MANATLTSKGQVTIPKEVRDRLGVKAGDRISFVVMPDGTVFMRAKTGSIRDMAGALHRPDQEPVPIEKLSF